MFLRRARRRADLSRRRGTDYRLKSPAVNAPEPVTKIVASASASVSVSIWITMSPSTLEAHLVCAIGGKRGSSTDEREGAPAMPLRSMTSPPATPRPAKSTMVSRVAAVMPDSVIALKSKVSLPAPP